MLKVNGGAKAGCSSRHLLQTCGLRVTAVDKNDVYWWFFFDLSVYVLIESPVNSDFDCVFEIFVFSGDFKRRTVVRLYV